MLRILNFEEIQKQLDEISTLVDLYEDKNPFFASKVKDWLKKTENILENNKLPIAGRIAGLRSQIISAERGIIDDRIQISGTQNKRKIANASASRALQDAGEIITTSLHSDIERFNEAERQASQIVTYFQANGAIAEFMGKPVNSETLSNMWHVVKSDANLAHGALNVESLVGPVDSLIFFSRALGSVLHQ